MWKIITEFIKQRGLQNQTQPSNEEEKTKYENLINDNRNFYLKGVTFNIHHSQQISVGISKMQGLTNSIRVTQESVFFKNPNSDKRFLCKIDRIYSHPFIHLKKPYSISSSSLLSRFITLFSGWKNNRTNMSPRDKFSPYVSSRTFAASAIDMILSFSLICRSFPNTLFVTVCNLSVRWVCKS